MKRLLLLVPLAGCPRGGDATPKPPQDEVYAGLFEPQRQWTYNVREDLGDGSEPSTYEVSCQVTDAGEDGGTRFSFVECDGTIGEGMQEAVAGVWVATAQGLWYVPELIPDEELPLQPPPPERLTAARMLLSAQEPQGSCHETPSPTQGASWAKLCFSSGGVSSGELGWDGSAHVVTFTETSEEPEPE